MKAFEPLFDLSVQIKRTLAVIRSNWGYNHLLNLHDMLTTKLEKSMKVSLKTLAGVVALAVAAVTIAETVEDRIAPVGKVCMAGDPCAAAVVISTAPATLRSGEEVYKLKCVTCHASGAAGAPVYGDAQSWAPRIAKGVEVLYTGAIGGIGGMPAKGLCFDCTDEEIKGAVDHMLAGSQ